MCLPRRRCDCNDDTGHSDTQPNRRREKAPKCAQRQPLPKNLGRTPTPANPQTSNEDEESGDVEYEPISSDPYSLSTGNPRTDNPEVSDTDSNKTSSSGDFHSAPPRNSHTGITPEMSEASLSESQYHSLPEERSFPASMPSTDEYVDEGGYDGADEGSLDLNQFDEEMYDESIEPEETGYSDQSWSVNSSDRRRRRSIESQARADAEYRGLFGTGSSSGSSKRQRLKHSSDISSGRQRTGVEPTVEDITRYRNIGAQYQAWIDDPDEPRCLVQPATLTIEEMVDETQALPWTVHESYYTVEPMALEGGDVESMNIARGGPRYRYTHLRRDPGPNTHEANEFEHRVARGILVAERIYKEDGPYWSEVARAQYLLDFNLKTLRHVLFTDIGNDETAPYIRHELYPRLGVMWSQARDVDCMVFKHGSAEYQELLGTKLGKGVACLILSSFPRGTMKITEIVTWCNTLLPQMRFVIEPVIAAPVTGVTAV
ncbi:uncharacterized protein PGRI_065370 [Penicillium griseofulvum]|uniref:Uncharacterized protein n=1 Tax=Penicillium patulum TaxID=5078 RepID=A0A135LPR8_PENPA|nr:uncharacterized protein PGRI_065370 [Penicillium griseofulvum]KXG50965.1 hypothetical protein PGRI_065370 [Penicillium griseofulvum]